jgi:hypothetical protein
MAWASRTRKSLRVKKYLKVMSLDPGIGFLLEGQPDIEPEGPLPSRSLLGRAHHAAPRPGHHHPARGCHSLAEGVRLLGDGMVGGGAGRAEHRHLGNPAPGGEYLVAVAQLLERGAGDLEVHHPRPVLEELEHGGEHVRVEPPRGGGDAQLLEQRVDGPIARLGL